MYNSVINNKAVAELTIINRLLGYKMKSSLSGNKISLLLIQEKLAACVNIIPNIESIYNWDNGIEKCKEILITIKTISEKIDNCKEIILKHHNYQIPELLITDCEIGNNSYKEWFIENIRKKWPYSDNIYYVK